MPRAWLLVAVVTTLALGTTVAQAASAAVAIRGASFQPASVTVNVGESVTWTNQDGIPHSAKADDGSFDTGVFSTGSRSVTFGGAGTFGYFCAVHPTTMRGTVRVLGQSTPAPAPVPTAPPTPVPTAAPVTRPTTAATAPPPEATAAPTPSPTPTPSQTPSPTTTTAPTPSPVAAENTVTPTPAATVAATSRSDDGPGPALILGAVAGLAALAGIGVYLARRP